MKLVKLAESAESAKAVESEESVVLRLHTIHDSDNERDEHLLQ